MFRNREVELRFIETKLTSAVEFGADPACLVWHTPRLDFPHEVESALGLPSLAGGYEEWEASWEPAEDWTVGTLGKDMTVEEAATALIEAEKEFYFPLYVGARHHEIESLDSRQYHLFIGDTGWNCAFCGGEHYAGTRPRRGMLTWRISVCKVCHARKLEDLYQAAPFPEALASVPAVVAWSTLHPALTSNTD